MRVTAYTPLLPYALGLFVTLPSDDDIKFIGAITSNRLGWTVIYTCGKEMAFVEVALHRHLLQPRSFVCGDLFLAFLGANAKELIS